MKGVHNNMPTKDPVKRKEQRKKYYQENKEEIYRKSRIYQASRKDRTNYLSRVNMHKLSTRRREEVYKLLGGVCVSCGFSDRRALQIDHVNGDGKSDRKRYTSQSLYLKHILEVSGVGYQILCANCNWIKRCENKECQTRKETNESNNYKS